jgi:hypothetical protein
MTEANLSLNGRGSAAFILPYSFATNYHFVPDLGRFTPETARPAT